MGGCRCMYRECPNNTINSPGVHFFHFPYKDAERCKRWAFNANKVEFLQLPHSKLRNKAICEIHFPDNCFMNFKKERLIQKAIPSLYKTSDGVFADTVDENEIAKLEYPVQGIHISGKAIDLPSDTTHAQSTEAEAEDNNQLVKKEPVMLENIQFDLEDNTEVVLESAANYTVKKVQPMDTSKPKILNKLHSDEPIVINKIDLLPLKVETVKRCTKETTRNQIVLKRIKTGEIYDIKSDTLNKMKDVKVEEHLNEQIPQITKKNSSKVLVSHKALPLSNPDTASTPMKSECDQAKEVNTIDKELYIQTMADHAKQIEELKTLLKEKIEKYECSSQSTAPTSSSSETRHIKVEKGPAMNKVQLFNGIRKYLNPTMVALLRMEMFGGSDREYRPDEKQFSKELFTLNQSVYDYMRDEWRFRLPAKSDVQSWLNEPDDEELWELC